MYRLIFESVWTFRPKVASIPWTFFLKSGLTAMEISKKNFKTLVFVYSKMKKEEEKVNKSIGSDLIQFAINKIRGIRRRDWTPNGWLTRQSMQSIFPCATWRPMKCETSRGLFYLILFYFEWNFQLLQRYSLSYTIQTLSSPNQIESDRRNDRNLPFMKPPNFTFNKS